ncbi:response regulator [Spirillospora sp. NPDC050679]
MGALTVVEGPSAERLFSGPDPAMALARATDWAATPLGPVAGWPPELCAAIRTVLPSRIPMLLWWGPELVQVYNGAYSRLLGSKHPAAMGMPAAECWAEIWDEIGPMAASVLDGGGATFSEELLLFMERHGYREETYWTFSYSPVEDAGGRVAGVFVATTDTTAQVLTERRLGTLRELGAVSAAQSRTGGEPVAEAYRAAVEVLGREPMDVPFALAYDAEGRLAAAAGVAGDVPEEMRRELREAALRAVGAGRAETVAGTAVALPLPAGALVLGVSPYRELDGEYRLFLDIAAAQVSVTVADALAYQAERRRAEALAELDAAKTRFFQNVSHEFRTPLTLLLGPLGELLDDPDLPEGHRAPLAAAHRSALRLRRLVDTLLDAARADAARLRAEPEATDLARLTADLAGMFRSAAERAGLRLEVDAPPLPGPVRVDREMWAKIVLNLLSNALKFTAEGTVSVRLRAVGGTVGGTVELAVADTGAGIPEADLPRVFERFHQVAGAHGRSREGTGIGLSLVADLVRALGGEVGAASAPGEGSTFTVRLPCGGEDLPEPRPSAREHETAVPFVAEALSWTAGPEAGAPEPAGDAPRVLLVEDNPDMRAYLVRLMARQGWRVDAAADGGAALELARRERPDLVLSDVMLPGRDGMELLRDLRADPALALLPVVLLTARAGSEAAVEGLEHGADDYVVKPFEPAELIARLRVQLETARLRESMVSDGERRASDLAGALDTRSLIGQAMGIVMAQQRCGPDEAFRLLSRMSQRRNVKLHDLARDLVRRVSGGGAAERVRAKAAPPPPRAGSDAS